MYKRLRIGKMLPGLLPTFNSSSGVPAVSQPSGLGQKTGM